MKKTTLLLFLPLATSPDLPDFNFLPQHAREQELLDQTIVRIILAWQNLMLVLRNF